MVVILPGMSLGGLLLHRLRLGCRVGVVSRRLSSGSLRCPPVGLALVVSELTMPSPLPVLYV